MVKRYLFLPAAVLLLHTTATAQLHVGAATSMYVKSGTTLATDSLVLVPSADLILDSITIQGNNSVVNGITGGASIVQVAVLSAPLSFAGTVGLYYDDAQLNGNAAATLELAYDAGGYWITTTGTTVNTTSHYLSQTFSTPVDLSSVTATSPGVTLPVGIYSFDAQAEGGRARLDWQVTSALQPASFELQRSADGRHFTSITQVAAVAGQLRYRTYDERPLAGVNYYRLRVVELDGTEQLSATRSLSFADKGGVSFYPVPAGDVLHISITGEPDATGLITLAGIDGKVLHRMPCTQKNSSIDLRAYPAGMYLFTYSGGGRTWRYKIEKH